ncbi:hypothetical protein M153_2100016523 [Pseudoloma neurophilia]|uniref:Checkpoint 9-1-1 complex, RAD1 component n=1 Tax=Pseudoloma neurophilia TaxID=146866 RepID=A0A0R0M0Z1_9MICR|nr:hypothetical protein M153_2100016523 [Pseudoloma neurophilia]
MPIDLTISNEHCLFLDRIFFLSSKYENTPNIMIECSNNQIIFYTYLNEDLIYFKAKDAFFSSIESEPSYFCVQLQSFWISGMTTVNISIKQNEMILKYFFNTENKFTRILDLMDCDILEMPISTFNYRFDQIINQMNQESAIVRIEYENIKIKQKSEISEKIITENIKKGGCNLQFSINYKQIKNLKRFHSIFDEFYGIERIFIGIDDDGPLSVHISNIEMDFYYFTAVDVQKIYDES